MTERDPLVDPRPGDWITNGKVEIRIDAVKGDYWVYYTKFKRGADMGFALCRMTLDQYREGARTESAKVKDG